MSTATRSTRYSALGKPTKKAVEKMALSYVHLATFFCSMEAGNLFGQHHEDD
jgi:hypothetical protein